MDGNNTPVVLPIHLTPTQVRPVAYRVISKKHGLNLKSAALEVLSKFLGHHFGAEWRSPQAEKSLDDISRRWKDEDRGIFVDGPPLAQVVKDWLNAEAFLTQAAGSEERFNWREYFKVVSVQDQQRLVFNPSKRSFEVAPSPPNVFASAKSLTQVFTSRYNILLDKVYRSELFQPSGLAATSANSSGGYTISPVKNLLGRHRGDEFFLFGLLEKQEDGPWVLIDPSSNITLEFTESTAFAPDHYYTSGSFALCHGHYMGDFFQVATLGPPPPERRAQSQEAFGGIDFYGLNAGPRRASTRSTRIERIEPALQKIMVDEEGAQSDTRFVFLGCDIFLDKPQVQDTLRHVFAELDSNPPAALVIPGSFLSAPFQPHFTNSDGSSAAQVYRDAMNAFADTLKLYENLAANSKIILIPGPNDPWHASSIGVLPYFPLPNVFTGRVDRAASDVVFASNPCRLCYLSQEIVLFRSDSGLALRKNSLDTDAIVQTSAGPEGNEETHMRDLSLNENEDCDDEDKLAEQAAINSMLDSNRLNLHVGQGAANDTHEARRVVATILDQCHLSPLPMNKNPVIWEYDHALSLAQWPTSLALLDPTTPAIKQVYEGCHVLNPGSFLLNGKANWVEFWPSTGAFQFRDS